MLSDHYVSGTLITSSHTEENKFYNDKISKNDKQMLSPNWRIDLN